MTFEYGTSGILIKEDSEGEVSVIERGAAYLIR